MLLPWNKKELLLRQFERRFYLGVLLVGTNLDLSIKECEDSCRDLALFGAAMLYLRVDYRKFD